MGLEVYTVRRVGSYIAKDGGRRKQRKRLRSDRATRGAGAYFGFGVFGGAFLAVLVAPAKETRHAVHGGEGGGRWGVACS